MPTKEDLTNVNIAEVRAMLVRILADTDRRTWCFTLIQFYELMVIIICKESGLTYCSDKYCYSMFSEWIKFVVARNTVSHNLYNTSLVYSNVKKLYNSKLLNTLADKYLDGLISWLPLKSEIEDYLEHPENAFWK